MMEQRTVLYSRNSLRFSKDDFKYNVIRLKFDTVAHMGHRTKIDGTYYIVKVYDV